MIKHQTKIATLLVVLSLASASCQKETIVDPRSHDMEEGNTSVCVIIYSVDGIVGRETVKNAAERSAFITRMIALSEKGHRVTFRQENTTVNALAPKDVQTFSTKDKDKAHEWMNEMMNQGYSVTIVFDEGTGYYNCTATRED